MPAVSDAVLGNWGLFNCAAVHSIKPADDVWWLSTGITKNISETNHLEYLAFKSLWQQVYKCFSLINLPEIHETWHAVIICAHNLSTKLFEIMLMWKSAVLPCPPKGGHTSFFIYSHRNWFHFLLASKTSS